MEPVTTAVGAVSLISKGSKLLTSLIKSVTDREMKADLNSLAGLLLDATHKALEQEQQIIELRRQVESFENWDETAAKYEVVALYEGRWAYKLRSPESGNDSNLRYCIHCFDTRSLSLLQECGNQIGIFECPACKYVLAPPFRPRNASVGYGSGPSIESW
jgi:hypothetical protein